MSLARLGRMAGTTVDEAWARDFRVAVDQSVDSGDPRTLASLFQLYGQVLGAHDRPESATRLLAHWAATSPDVSNPIVHTAVERWQARLSAELGEAQFAKLWNDGAAMTTAEAVQLVRRGTEPRHRAAGLNTAARCVSVTSRCRLRASAARPDRYELRVIGFELRPTSRPDARSGVRAVTADRQIWRSEIRGRRDHQAPSPIGAPGSIKRRLVPRRSTS